MGGKGADGSGPGNGGKSALPTEGSESRWWTAGGREGRDVVRICDGCGWGIRRGRVQYCCE